MSSPQLYSSLLNPEYAWFSDLRLSPAACIVTFMYALLFSLSSLNKSNLTMCDALPVRFSCVGWHLKFEGFICINSAVPVNGTSINISLWYPMFLNVSEFSDCFVVPVCQKFGISSFMISSSSTCIAS